MILNERCELLLDGGGVPGDPDRLQAVALAGGDGEGPLRQAEGFGPKFDSRFIGLALLRLPPHFDLKRHAPVATGLAAGHLSGRPPGRDTRRWWAARSV